MAYKVRVDAQFPELPAAHYNISDSGEGSTKKSAISDGIRNILNNPRLKGKRYTNFKLNVYIEGTDSTGDPTDSDVSVNSNTAD